MESNTKIVYTYLLVAVVVMLGGGTVFYHFQEDLTYVDSFYFCVTTLSTVGYGDITPKTNFGKLFTSVYILMGVGIITTFFSIRLRRRGEKMKGRRDARAEPSAL